MAEVCNICCDIFIRTRPKITCEFCQFAACRKCIETYLITQSDANCMSCRNIWNRKSLHSKLTRTFLDKEYKKHHEKILYERELALMPGTQIIVEENKTNKTVRDARLRELDIMIGELVSERKELLANSQVVQLTSANKKEFVHPCANNLCKGFVSSKYKCGLCEKYTCRNCFELKEEDHECEPDAVETARAIKKETVPCPKCSTRIFKINGCDQMFCTMCHTPFCWRTGKIISSTRIHNPHFFDWLQTQPADLECGQHLNANFAQKFDVINKFRIRAIIHLQEVILPAFETNAILDNVLLRIQFLMNDIDEKVFKSRIHASERERERKKDYHDLMSMFIAAASDIYFRASEDDPNTYESELLTLVDYVNRNLVTISKLYKTKCYVLYDDFNFQL